MICCWCCLDLLGPPGYFKLPYEYWRQGWHQELTLPAKAMLLVALSHGDGFTLPYNKLAEWYGISATSGQRGLAELRNRGLLHRERHRRRDPESPVGFADVYHYQLLPPFGPNGKASSAQPKFWKGPAPITKRKRRKTKSGRTKAKREPS